MLMGENEYKRMKMVGRDCSGDSGREQHRRSKSQAVPAFGD